MGLKGLANEGSFPSSESSAIVLRKKVRVTQLHLSFFFFKLA